MALPEGWTPPTSWSEIEKEIFSELRAGREVDKRPMDAAKKVLASFVPTDALPDNVSGAFLSEIIRKYMDEFPLGVQIYGVKITGKLEIPDVRVTKVIALEHCHCAAPVVATDCRFITFSLIGSVMRKFVDLRGSGVEGSLFLRRGFRSEEAILLRDMRITGTLDCTAGAFFYNRNGTIDRDIAGHAKGECFSFARSTAAALYWKEMQERPIGLINLRNCRIGSFRDDIGTREKLERDWPSAPCLRIAGTQIR